MDMIGHDDKFVHDHKFEPFAQATPFVQRQETQSVQANCTFHYLTKQRCALVGYQGDEIRAGPGIIVSLQADGAAMVFLRVVFHGDFVG
jgi:hypothetical protein